MTDGRGSDGKTEWLGFLDRFSSDVRKADGEIEETLINRTKNRAPGETVGMLRTITIHWVGV